MTASVKRYLFYPILYYLVKIFWDPDCVSWSFSFPSNLHVICAYGKPSINVSNQVIDEIRSRTGSKAEPAATHYRAPLESHFT